MVFPIVLLNQLETFFYNLFFCECVICVSKISLTKKTNKKKISGRDQNSKVIENRKSQTNGDSKREREREFDQFERKWSLRFETAQAR